MGVCHGRPASAASEAVLVIQYSALGGMAETYCRTLFSICIKRTVSASPLCLKQSLNCQYPLSFTMPTFTVLRTALPFTALICIVSMTMSMTHVPHDHEAYLYNIVQYAGCSFITYGGNYRGRTRSADV